MGASRERFLLKEEERRKNRATAALVLGGLGLVVAGLAVGAWYLATDLREPGPPPPGILRLLAILVAPSLLVMGAGLLARFRPRHYVSVDPVVGTATFVRNGAVSREVPLSEVGPLRHVVRTRRVRDGDAERLATFHLARSEPFPELLLCESEDELETRRSLEAHARAWKVPYVRPTGERRGPEELGVPVFQRLASDEAVTTPLPQRPDSKLVVGWKDGGYEISTSYRPTVDRVRLFLALLVPPVLVGWLLRHLFLDALGSETPAPLRIAAPLVFASSFLPGVVLGVKAWRRSRRPPVIRVAPDGVRTRGAALPLASIEEVERIPGAVCRLVSDERIVTIDADFCEASEHEWLHHELRRLVVQVGQQTPLA